MIIRIKKLHICLLALLLVSVSFVFTLKSEKIEKTSASGREIELPIIMYHHVTEDISKAGKYVITTDELEEDFKYINKKGYKTVTVEELIRFSEGYRELPEKIIMVTFDDGFKSVYKLALPLLEKHNIKAVIAPVGAITEEYTQNGNNDINYSYMTWDELKILNDNPLTEIQSHTYNMHTLSKNGKSRSGMAMLSYETDEAYRKALEDDLLKMQNDLKNKCGITATAIAYPYGLYSGKTLEIIRDLGFKSNFLCEEKINIIRNGDKNSLYNLGRFNRPSGIKTEDFFKKMLNC